MYCRQIFWSLIQNDDFTTIFQLILHNEDQIDSKNDSKDVVESMRAFTVFIKVIGNECFITNNKKYIQSFKLFIRKVIDTCCQSGSKYQALLRILITESILESYHDYFNELTGDNSTRKHIFEYFQSESKAEILMNPIIL